MSDFVDDNMCRSSSFRPHTKHNDLVEMQRKIDFERLWELTDKAINDKLSREEQRELDALNVTHPIFERIKSYRRVCEDVTSN